MEKMYQNYTTKAVEAVLFIYDQPDKRATPSSYARHSRGAAGMASPAHEDSIQGWWSRIATNSPLLKRSGEFFSLTPSGVWAAERFKEGWSFENGEWMKGGRKVSANVAEFYCRRGIPIPHEGDV